MTSDEASDERAGLLIGRALLQETLDRIDARLAEIGIEIEQDSPAAAAANAGGSHVTDLGELGSAARSRETEALEATETAAPGSHAKAPDEAADPISGMRAAAEDEGASRASGGAGTAATISERREGDATPSAPPTALSPVPGETAATDYFAIPPVLDRANWHNGHPPGRA